MQKINKEIRMDVYGKLVLPEEEVFEFVHGSGGPVMLRIKEAA